MISGRPPKHILAGFLLDAFTPEEFCALLRSHEATAGLPASLSLQSSPENFFFEAVFLLSRHGLIDGRFFRGLERARPARAREVSELTAAMLGTDSQPLPSQRMADLRVNTEVEFKVTLPLSELTVEKLTDLVTTLQKLAVHSEIVVVHLRAGSFFLRTWCTFEDYRTFSRWLIGGRGKFLDVAHVVITRICAGPVSMDGQAGLRGARRLAEAAGLRGEVEQLPRYELQAPEISEIRRIGRYALLGRLDEGAMCVVYKAYDEEHARLVALKILRAPERGNRQARVQLKREAQARARLSHPNVVQVLDVGEWCDTVFIAFEFVRGQTLRNWLSGQATDWPGIVRIFMQAGRGLAAVHAAGLVHRDFKLENVLIADTAQVLVVDLGLADWRASGPEGHVPSESADARSDQFAFCVALYEVLFGRRPFSGETASERRMNAMADNLPPPPPTGAPKWLRDLTLRGLSAHPLQRYPDMNELLRAMERETDRAWLMHQTVRIVLMVLVVAVIYFTVCEPYWG